MDLAGWGTVLGALVAGVALLVTMQQHRSSVVRAERIAAIVEKLEDGPRRRLLEEVRDELVVQAGMDHFRPMAWFQLMLGIYLPVQAVASVALDLWTGNLTWRALFSLLTFSMGLYLLRQRTVDRRAWLKTELERRELPPPRPREKWFFNLDRLSRQLEEWRRQVQDREEKRRDGDK